MEYQRITSLSHPLFDETWRVYEQSFPASERRTREDHLRALEDAAFHACAAVENGLLLAIVFYWQTEAFTFLEHLAVDSPMRGTLCGTRALQKLFAETPAPLILEIEQPADEATRRREHFYERLGFALQPYPHGAFSYQERTVCVPLCLMARPAITQAQYEAFHRFFTGHVLTYTKYRQ